MNTCYNEDGYYYVVRKTKTDRYFKDICSNFDDFHKAFRFKTIEDAKLNYSRWCSENWTCFPIDIVKIAYHVLMEEIETVEKGV